MDDTLPGRELNREISKVIRFEDWTPPDDFSPRSFQVGKWISLQDHVLLAQRDQISCQFGEPTGRWLHGTDFKRKHTDSNPDRDFPGCEGCETQRTCESFSRGGAPFGNVGTRTGQNTHALRFYNTQIFLIMFSLMGLGIAYLFLHVLTPGMRDWHEALCR